MPPVACGSVRNCYDAHGRQNTATDACNGTTTYTFNSADQVTTVTTPNPGTPGGTPQTTTTEYDTSLRAWRVTQPDATTVTSEFFLDGSLQKIYGSRTYPVEYTYDYAGRMKTMKTWQDFNESTGSGTSGSAVTTWNYNPYRGWLDAKRYPLPTGEGQGEGPDYTYTKAGRLQSRAWARGADRK